MPTPAKRVNLWHFGGFWRWDYSDAPSYAHRYFLPHSYMRHGSALKDIERQCGAFGYMIEFGPPARYKTALGSPYASRDD